MKALKYHGFGGFSMMLECSKNFYLIVFFVLIKNIITIGYHVDTHRLAKRMDLESCLGRFDVHKDTIIRTEESQSIGGKFLQGVGLETLEECQRLCCESEGCDVFIFEEKGEGYCYLFECGPPENFHCKFTRHANYTSAVLTPVRHLTSPTTHKPHSSLQMPLNSLSQNELELTNLKTRVDLNTQSRKMVSTILPPLGIRVGETITTTKSPPIDFQKCGRFQFQCHSGECIAVYNACNGIPQCQDGSDEGPECPASPVIQPVSAPVAKPPMETMNADSGLLQIQQSGILPQSDYMMSVPKQIIEQSMPSPYQEQSMHLPAINNREDPLSSPNWQARKMPEVQQEQEQNSHIFSHKGGLQLQSNNVVRFQNEQPNTMYNQMQRELYGHPEIQDMYRSPATQSQDHLVGSPNMNWPQQQLSLQQQMLSNPQQQFVPQNTQDHNAILMKQRPPPEPVQKIPHPVTIPTTANTTLPKPSGSISQTKTEVKTGDSSKHTHHSHSHDSNESEQYEDDENKSTDPPKRKQRIHRKQKDERDKAKKSGSKPDSVLKTPVHDQFKMLEGESDGDYEDGDGYAQRPKGAILSLTLGIAVTAVLAIIIGCRMRVGRRIRRHGKIPFAHDADFLVNGMYL